VLAEQRDPNGAYVPGAHINIVVKGTVNFPAGEKLTA
jgi:hypothetical protein